MLALKENNPEVYKNFSGACFVIRRSDRTWAGLSPDLVIKQVLMRALKSTGGLTRGAGFNETQRAIWCLSMPVTSAYNLKMQELTNTLFETSEQHKGSSSTRVARDQDDTKKVLSFLRQISPFESATGLKNIATGVVADNDVNVDNLISIGKRIVCEMEVKDVYKCVLKRRDKVKTRSSETSMSLQDKEKCIDSHLLFQRFVILADSSILVTKIARAMNYAHTHQPYSSLRLCC